MLRGARVSLDANTAIPADLEIVSGRIRRVLDPQRSGPSFGPHESYCEIDLRGCLLLPGLINAHDHLEFNLFPKLGKGPYPNATEWAQDIYHPNESPAREHRAVPKGVRLTWGGIKNLVTGATTVCHHNEYLPDVFDHAFPIRVIRRYALSHSLLHGADADAAFLESDSDVPFILHLGEGTDDESRAELYELDRRGLLSHRTVIVHGVALQEKEQSLVVERSAGVIWCPGSNLYTLGTTLAAQFVQGYERVALGSDSALTSDDLLAQIRLAYAMGIPANVIFEMVTTRSAKVLNLNGGEGRLSEGSVADLLVIPDRAVSPAQALVWMSPEDIDVVFLEGQVNSVSDRCAPRLHDDLMEGLQRFRFSGTVRNVRAPIQEILTETKKHLGDAIELAGWKVAA